MMHKIISFCLLLTAVPLLLNSAEPVLLKRTEKQTEDKNVLRWFPTDGAMIAVTPDEVILSGKRLEIGPHTSFRELGPGFFGLQFHDGEQTSLEWFDPQGDPVGAFRESWPYDVALPRYFIDRTSGNAISIDMLNRIRLISPAGTIISESDMFRDYRYHNENTIHALVTESGQDVFACLTQVAPHRGDLPAYVTRIKYFGLNGETRFEHELNGWQVNAVAGRTDGSLFAVSLYKHDPAARNFTFEVLVIDPSGSITDRFNASFRDLVFCGPDHVLLLNKDTAIIYDLKVKNISGTYRQSDPDRILMTAEYVDTEKMIVVEEGRLAKNQYGWYYDNISLLAFNMQAGLIEQVPLDGNSVTQPFLRYEPEQRQIFLGHRTGWITYQLNRQ